MATFWTLLSPGSVSCGAEIKEKETLLDTRRYQKNTMQYIVSPGCRVSLTLVLVLVLVLVVDTPSPFFAKDVEGITSASSPPPTFLSDPGKPGVRSLGPDVTNKQMLCKT